MPEPSETLPESRLFTFIDEPRQFALYFLEGQRLIRDLALLHGVRGEGFAYFRGVVLSIQPMIAYLKRGEQFGFYIDSEDPLFRLKIESAHHGDMRCALVPEDFHEFPERMTGIVRLLKLFPNNRAPYESVLRAVGEPLGELVNRVLRDSYQVHSAVTVSERSDQSALLHLLPPISGREDYEYSAEAVERRQSGIEDRLDRIFGRALAGPEEIERAFAEVGFRLLAARPIRFRCSCSRDRVLRNLRLLRNAEFHELFDPGQEAIEVVCEYCKSRYRVGRQDLDRLEDSLN